MRLSLRLLAALALLGVVIFLPAAPPATAAAAVVSYPTGVAPGTIVINTSERRLYFVTGNGHALRYSVGVGKPGREWQGKATIDGKFLLPNWVPPDAIRREKPGLPDMIPGGSPANPMGAAALTLSGGSYAIHGTNTPSSVGGFVSYGCFRMLNEDIIDLYARVRIGTAVVVTR
jgi:lipoprotein-anchoring transpeptidase ErfK/SrfK